MLDPSARGRDDPRGNAPATRWFGVRWAPMRFVRTTRARPGLRHGVRRGRLLATGAIVLLLSAAGCGGDDVQGGASSTVPAAAGAELTTDTTCADWLAAPADARAAALASTAGYADGGVNAWIAEARRTLATSPEAAASVPDTVPVDEGVGIVDRACAAVAPDDSVGQAIPAYDYDAAHGGATAP